MLNGYANEEKLKRLSSHTNLDPLMKKSNPSISSRRNSLTLLPKSVNGSLIYSVKSNKFRHNSATEQSNSKTTFQAGGSSVSPNSTKSKESIVLALPESITRREQFLPKKSFSNELSKPVNLLTKRTLSLRSNSNNLQENSGALESTKNSSNPTHSSNTFTNKSDISELNSHCSRYTDCSKLTETSRQTNEIQFLGSGQAPGHGLQPHNLLLGNAAGPLANQTGPKKLLRRAPPHKQYIIKKYKKSKSGQLNEVKVSSLERDILTKPRINFSSVHHNSSGHGQATQNRLGINFNTGLSNSQRQNFLKIKRNSLHSEKSDASGTVIRQPLLLREHTAGNLKSQEPTVVKQKISHQRSNSEGKVIS